MPTRVQLLSSFTCRVPGREVALGEIPRSLIVSLALGERRVTRSVMTARLWPDLEPVRAAKRLRQALWRMHQLTGQRVVEASPEFVELAADAWIDLDAAEHTARLVLSAGASREQLAGRPADTWRPLGLSLLPGFPGEEVYLAQQRWDRLRLMALEGLATVLLAQGNIPDAIETASRAAAVDDLSEGPYRLLVQAHLARNDVATAQRVFTGYSRTLRRHLGVDPSPEFGKVLKILM